MSNNQQPFPNDFRMRLLNSFREPAPAQAAIDTEQAKADAEAASVKQAANAVKQDAEALEIFETYLASNPYQRAFIRTQYGTATLDRGKVLHAAKAAK